MAENTLSIKLELAIAQFLRNSKRAATGYQSDLRQMSSLSAREGNKIRAAMDQLGVRPFGDIERDVRKVEVAYERLRRSGTLTPAALAQAQFKLKERTRELRAETNGWGQSLSRAQAGILAGITATAGLASITARAGRQYARFGDQMAEVNTLLQTSEENVSKLSKQVRKLSVETGTNAGDNAGALYQIISSGAGGAAESNFALEESIKAAIAGITDTETAATAGLAIINAYGGEVGQLPAVFDDLFTTVRLGVTTFPELANNIGNVLSSAVSAEVPLQELTAAIAELTKAGIRTPIATNAIRGAIDALVAPAPEAQQALQDLGIEWRGLISTIGDIAALNLGPKALRQVIPDVEARKAVSALTNNYDRLIETLVEFDSNAGATADALEIVKQGPGQAGREFAASVSELNLQLGELVHQGRPVIEVLTAMVRGFNELDDGTKLFVGGSAGFLTGLAAWNLGLNRVFDALGLITSRLGGLRTIAGVGLFATATVQTVRLVGALDDYLQTLRDVEKSEAKRISNLTRLQILNQQNATVQDLSEQQLRALGNVELSLYRERLESAQAFHRARFEALVAAGKNETDQSVRDAQQQNRHYTELLGVVRNLFDERTQQQNRLAGDLQFFQTLHRNLTRQQIDDIGELIDANQKRVDELERDLQAGVRAEQRAMQQVRQLREELAGIQQSTTDRVRELRRRDMNEAQQQADIEADVADKIRTAREALANGQFDQAAGLGQSVQSLASRLVDTEKAIAVTQEAGRILAQVKRAEITAANEAATAQVQANEKTRQSIAETQTTIEQLQRDLASLDESLAEPEVTLEGYNETMRQLADLESQIDRLNRKSATVSVSSGPQRRRWGGPVFARTGRQLPGFGGGDRVPVLAEAGEWIINKERSRRFGSLLSAINSAPINQVRDLLTQHAFVPRFEVGGIVPGAVPAAAAPATTAPAGDVVALTINLGGPRTFDLFGQRQQVSDFVDALESVSRG